MQLPLSVKTDGQQLWIVDTTGATVGTVFGTTIRKRQLIAETLVNCTNAVASVARTALDAMVDDATVTDLIAIIKELADYPGVEECHFCNGYSRLVDDHYELAHADDCAYVRAQKVIAKRNSSLKMSSEEVLKP